MLELSMFLPVKVQNGGLFISRGIGSHPARQLHSWEIIFVEKGILTIRENNTVFSVSSGESLLLWPQRLHVGIGQFPADLKFYWLHFEVTTEGHTSLPEPLLSIRQHTRVSEPQYIISLFRQFLREQENIHRSVALELILLLILQQISAAASEQPIDTPGNALAWKAQQIILTQFHLPISASTLAKELHCNADYLGRVYRHVFRLTLTEALHRQRVRAAEKLLISDSLSLTEVATKCGFNDVGYFRKIFRKHTSLTPAAWKRLYCKEHVNSA
ncbi:helix-turn-helix domain-containing protein [Klebsiella indica]|uniref:Arabinose operon regulatory protein n=1 Tax=Klebsiella indica TaxID=2582917 RepID=A0A5R9LMX8_9ENTR|nr:helix-turn-helix domain-containing protein [Klebsiella indica]TLV22372.1 helix-turn-helix domain-containing protein [Klebsiella indica]